MTTSSTNDGNAASRSLAAWLALLDQLIAMSDDAVGPERAKDYVLLRKLMFVVASRIDEASGSAGCPSPTIHAHHPDGEELFKRGLGCGCGRPCLWRLLS